MTVIEGEIKKRQGARNLGASLRQKLRNQAKTTGDDVALLLTRYINERFLYRLSLSPYRDRFILRGATLFTLWNSEPHRPTRDIDLMASGDSSPEAMREILGNVCSQTVEADGVDFDLTTLHIEARAEGRVYQGLHIEMLTMLGTARPRLEIDIAFGEAVIPPPVEMDLPVLLEMPSPRLRVYRMETAVAEKCQAIVSLGVPNTRMKDFYDIWYLSRTYSFDGVVVSEAFRATFERRNTPFPEGGVPTALTAAFADDSTKHRQWAAFLGKTRLKTEAVDLSELISSIRSFLQPPLASLAERGTFRLQWSPEDFWT